MNILISFIIPAYNAEPYLRACLDSVYAFDMQEYGKEVIVINDGSTDGTAAFLQTYQREHPNLKVITQANAGLSCARNAGMDAATGTYLCFVDADDRLSKGVTLPLEQLLPATVDLFGIELVQVDAHGVRKPYRRYVPPYNQMYTPARRFMLGRNLMPCAPAYLYRRACLQRHGLRFMPGIFHEDEDLLPRVFAVADSFMALDVPLYERFVRPDSITTTTDPQKMQQKLRDIVAILEGLDALAHTDADLRRCMQCKLDYLAVDTLRLLLRQRHPRAFRREVVGALRAIGYFPLHWRNDWKHVLFNLFTRVFFAIDGWF